MLAAYVDFLFSFSKLYPIESQWVHLSLKLELWGADFKTFQKETKGWNKWWGFDHSPMFMCLFLSWPKTQMNGHRFLKETACLFTVRGAGKKITALANKMPHSSSATSEHHFQLYSVDCNVAVKRRHFVSLLNTCPLHSSYINSI